MRLGVLALLGLGILGTAMSDAQDGSLTPRTLQAALAAHPAGAEAERLAERVRETFGREALARGTGARFDADGLTVAWAIEAAGAASPPRVVSDLGHLNVPLIRLGETDVYAAAVTLPDGTAARWAYQVGETRRGGGQLEAYATPPDNLPRPGVPQGKVTEQPKWKSHIFPDTEREWWIYVPAQYGPDRPAAVMVFQDGAGPKSYVPTVFDNLIARGDMPVTVGIFIQPGTIVRDGRPAGSNRSFEYDTLSDRYSRFLLEEILPEVEKTVKLRHDPAGRALSGISSGGICAFTAAWERPDQFSKVLSWVGSFTNIASGPTRREGGHNYPALIRKTPPKPIRVFLQDGANDLDNEHGNWPLANQQMASSLAFMGYDFKFVFGHGFHSDRQGRAILPESLTWLWRGWRDAVP
jgi:enterochelin esterase-like enzyme